MGLGSEEPRRAPWHRLGGCGVMTPRVLHRQSVAMLICILFYLILQLQAQVTSPFPPWPCKGLEHRLLSQRPFWGCITQTAHGERTPPSPPNPLPTFRVLTVSVPGAGGGGGAVLHGGVSACRGSAEGNGAPRLPALAGKTQRGQG